MNPDGMSYLDVADAYRNGPLREAINGYWSPLYSWLFAAVDSLSQARGVREFSVAHALNFGIFVVALACFEVMMAQAFLARGSGDGRTDNGRPVPEWVLRSFGYTLFIWCACVLVTVSMVTPDQLVAAAVFICFAILMRWQRGEPSTILPIALGAALGLGYLAKAVMFVLVPAFILAAAAQGAYRFGWRRAARDAVVVGIAFSAVAAPFLLALSESKGRFTFGDTGKVNYAWYVSGVTSSGYWRGEGDDSGTPKHPVRQVLASPPVYEFATPLKATYPLWYDPSYWYEGVHAKLHLAGQIRVVNEALRLYIETFAILIPVIIMMAILVRQQGAWRAPPPYWSFLIPTAAAFALYSLVHVEDRHIGMFGTAAFFLAFSGVRYRGASARRTTAALVAGLCVTLFLKVGVVLLWEFSRGGLSPRIPLERDMPYVRVAAALERHGVAPGSKVGMVGQGLTAYWARLHRVRIIAESPAPSDFWRSENARRAVVSAMRAAGADVVVAEGQEADAQENGWVRLSDGLFLLQLRPQASERGVDADGLRETREAVGER